MYQVDWVQLIPVFSDVLIGISAVTGAIVVIIGLRSWSREYIGRIEYDLSRRILNAIYKVRNGIEIVRKGNTVDT